VTEKKEWSGVLRNSVAKFKKLKKSEPVDL
jgi:hypothetical protein